MKPPTDTDGLTARQRAVLDAIRDSVDTRGYPPSVREVMAAVGLQTPSACARQIGILVEKGYLRRDPHLPRALVLLDPGQRPCGACGGTGHVPAGAA